MPFVSSIRLVALMIFIALVAVAVRLADLRLAIALPLVGAAWLIAAAFESLAWRATHDPAAAVETASVPPPPPPAVDRTVVSEPEPVPAADRTLSSMADEQQPPPEPVGEPETTDPDLEAQEDAAHEPVIAAEPEPVVPAGSEPQAELEPPESAGAEMAIIATADRPSRWPRRRRLRAVPTPPAEPASPPPGATPPLESRVVSLPQRTNQPRSWNIWDLESLVRAEVSAHPERRDEWAFLFVHLRQFANADGELPAEFDSLVRESFGSLLEGQPIR